MKRKDWLLIALDRVRAPIQIQKTLFKFAMEAELQPSERYKFVPYNWGPCSFAIYKDLTQLREEGLVSFEPSGRGWNEYALTNDGEQVAAKLRSQANGGALTSLDGIAEYVGTRGFGKLLEDVYEEYPDYAERSLFRK